MEEKSGAAHANTSEGQEAGPRRPHKRPKKPPSAGNNENSAVFETTSTSGGTSAAASVPPPVPGSATGATPQRMISSTKQDRLVPASVMLAKKRPKKHTKGDAVVAAAVDSAVSVVSNAKSTAAEASAGAGAEGAIDPSGNGFKSVSTSSNSSAASSGRSRSKKQSSSSGAVSQKTQQEIARTLNAAAAAFVPPPALRTSVPLQAYAASAPAPAPAPVHASSDAASSSSKPKPAKNKKVKTATAAAIANPNANVEDDADDNDDSTSSCIICADSLKFVAVGSCDHPVCSKCALRLRIKNNDKGCPVCRTDLQVMVVCNAGYCSGKIPVIAAKSNISDAFAVPAFASWEITSLDAPMPGCEVDALSGLVFVDCKAHCKEMQALRAIQCPILGCGQRMGNHAALLKHTKTAHSQQFCSLCLEHRTLFVSEQILYTEKSLKKHMDSAPTEGDLLSGHPECQFCKRHQFDAMQLYQHMQSAHCTCPLCPTEHQFRFYQNPSSLLAHLKSAHYVCEYCTEIDSSIGPVAYATAQEYASHLSAAHGQHRAPRALLSLASYGASSSSRSTTDSAFVDLDMSQANPNRPASRRQHGHNTYRGEEVPLVPANMRIAGHVTGSGQFHRTAADEAIERASEEAHARSAAGRLRQGGGGQWVAAQGNASFPTLSSGAPAAARPTTGTHSLSLVAQQAERIREQREERLALEAQRADAEKRKAMRNQQLADSFGVAAQPTFVQGAPVASVGSSTTAAGSSVSFADLLRRPLYTPNIVAWASKDIHEVVKIERKLDALVKTPSDSSVQLKPMTAGARAYVHAMARYYGLHSYEFDPEPRRYISLVKTVDTSVPPVLLSTAAQERPFLLHEGLHKQNLPYLYFQLMNGYFASTHNEGPTNDVSRAGDGGRGSATSSGSRLWAGGACVAQVVGALRSCLQSEGVLEDPSMALATIQPCGPHGVLLELKTVRAANLAYHLLQMEWQVRKSSRTAFGTMPPPGSSASALDEPYILDLYQIETAFVPGFEGELQRSNQEQANFTAVHAQAVMESQGNGRNNTAAVDAAVLLSRLEEKRRATQEWQLEIQESWDSDNNDGNGDNKMETQNGSGGAAVDPIQEPSAPCVAPELKPMYAFPWPCLNQASCSNVLNVNPIPYERPARTRTKLKLAPRTLPLPMLPPAQAAADAKKEDCSAKSDSGIGVWKPSARVLAARDNPPNRADRGEALLEAGGALAAEFASQTIQQHRAMSSGQAPVKNKASLQAYLDSDSDDDSNVDVDKNYFECLIGPDGKIVIPRDKEGKRIRKSNIEHTAFDAVPLHLRRIAELSLGVTMQWECTQCTFINDTGGQVCEICLCQAPGQH